MIPLVQLVVAIVIVGALLWGLESLPAIDPTFKAIARVILIVAVVIWAALVLLSWLGGAWMPTFHPR